MGDMGGRVGLVFISVKVLLRTHMADISGPRTSPRKSGLSIPGVCPEEQAPLWRVCTSRPRLPLGCHSVFTLRPWLSRCPGPLPSQGGFSCLFLLVSVLSNTCVTWRFRGVYKLRSFWTQNNKTEELRYRAKDLPCISSRRGPPLVYTACSSVWRSEAGLWCPWCFWTHLQDPQNLVLSWPHHRQSGPWGVSLHSRWTASG